MAKKKPTSRKGVQLAAIEAVVRQCKDRTFSAKEIRDWLREIKKSRIADHLKTMAKDAESGVVRESRGVYANRKMK